MDATQAISDSFLESDEEESEEEIETDKGKPLAKLCVLKNPHIPETGEWVTPAAPTPMHMHFICH